mmetsp:Transcript_78685/g.175954  ORF Transcript_78685/g.175954 Transcript_78685/m.175954 type:complete len:215 (-) Transcript_78685:134-778(-)
MNACFNREVRTSGGESPGSSHFLQRARSSSSAAPSRPLTWVRTPRAASTLGSLRTGMPRASHRQSLSSWMISWRGWPRSTHRPLSWHRLIKAVSCKPSERMESRSKRSRSDLDVRASAASSRSSHSRRSFCAVQSSKRSAESRSSAARSLLSKSTKETPISRAFEVRSSCSVLSNDCSRSLRAGISPPASAPSASPFALGRGAACSPATRAAAG